MSDADLIERLRVVLSDVAPDLDVATIGVDADLRNDVGLDSMDFLNFVIGVSKRLGVAIPEADYRDVATLETCARYIVAHGGR
jgi:acyl carrier protein